MWFAHKHPTPVSKHCTQSAPDLPAPPPTHTYLSCSASAACALATALSCSAPAGALGTPCGSSTAGRSSGAPVSLCCRPSTSLKGMPSTCQGASALDRALGCNSEVRAVTGVVGVVVNETACKRGVKRCCCPASCEVSCPERSPPAQPPTAARGSLRRRCRWRRTRQQQWQHHTLAAAQPTPAAAPSGSM
jgi:hypothetical protein